MLNRRARGGRGGYAAHEVVERPPTYSATRGTGRGDRGRDSYAPRGRGSSQYPFTSSAYLGTRGRGAYYPQEPAYQFKAKDKGDDKKPQRSDPDMDQKQSVHAQKRKPANLQSSENEEDKFDSGNQEQTRSKYEDVKHPREENQGPSAENSLV
jgi:hypothetical protein